MLDGGSASVAETESEELPCLCSACSIHTMAACAHTPCDGAVIGCVRGLEKLGGLVERLLHLRRRLKLLGLPPEILPIMIVSLEPSPHAQDFHQ